MNSYPYLVTALLILLLGSLALISLFRPKFTTGIFVCYGLLMVNSYLHSPELKKNYYQDICNELRNDIKCLEKEDSFECRKEGELQAIITSKEVCINNTKGNSDYDFVAHKSEHLGKTYVTKIPLFYIKNLPRNNCRNRSCGYKYDREIVEFRNPCSNCLDERRLTTKLRIEYIPVGTNLTVVDSFKLEKNNTVFRDRAHEVLVLEDEKGVRSEIMEFSFDSDIIRGSRNGSERFEKTVITNIQHIKDQGYLEKKYCFASFSVDHQVPDGSSIPERIEKRLVSFVNSFKLNDEMGYSKVDSSRCSLIRFDTVASYLLSFYYFNEWSLYIE